MSLAGAASTRTPPGWVAHSAYGIQVSVPRSWKVTYFSPCYRTDTLNMGAADYGVNCPNDDAGSWVTIYSTQSGGSLLLGDVPLTVHGIHLYRVRTFRSGPTIWLIPLGKVAVGLTGFGTKAVTVMRTVASR